jgi:hypothetical protein
MPDSIFTNRQNAHGATMSSSGDSPETKVFAPGAAQLARVSALNRFNRFFIYLPFGAFVILVIALIGALLFFAVRPPYEDTRPFLSGVSDVILVFFMLPVILVVGLIEVGIIGTIVYFRFFAPKTDAQSQTAASKYGRLRTWLWRLDQLITIIQHKVDTIMTRLARPIINLNSIIAYLESWYRSIWQRRDKNNG